jgi:hypothetical protein
MNATILRGRVGDATIGMTLEDVTAALGEPLSVREGEDAVVDYPGLQVTLYEGHVHMLIVESPTVGQTELGVSVGMSWKDLKRRVGPLEYDEENGLWISKRTPGIWYEVARPPRDYEEPIDPPFVTEVYEISDPKNAVVRRIYVM